MVDHVEVWHDNVADVDFVCANSVGVQNQITCFQIQVPAK